MPVRLRQRDEHPPGPGVLDRVGQRLRDDQPGDGLDVLGVADAAQHRVGFDHDLNGQPGGLGLDRLQQALVGQHRRVDRVGEVAQLAKQVAQVPLELGEGLVGSLITAAQPLAGQGQLGGQFRRLPAEDLKPGAQLRGQLPGPARPVPREPSSRPPRRPAGTGSGGGLPKPTAGTAGTA